MGKKKRYSQLKGSDSYSLAEHYQYGGVSKEGYKANSPDRFNPYNIIPSNNITMKNVRHPVLGIDNTGARKLMYPGMNYQFPGQAVFEIPMRGFGGNVGYYQQGGQARLVSVVPEGYDPIGMQQGRPHYAKTLLSSLPMASATSASKGGSEYEQFLINKLSTGVTPEELVQKKYISPALLEKYRSYYKPQRDVVYTEPPPLPPPVNNPAQAFSGDYLFGPDKHAVAEIKYPTRKSTGQSDPGTLPPPENVQFMFVDQMGKPDPSRGFYEIPNSVFSNQMTGGTQTLKDTTGISRYRVPFQQGGEAMQYMQLAGEYDPYNPLPAMPIRSVYDRLKPNPFPGLSPIRMSVGLKASMENHMKSLYDKFDPMPVAAPVTNMQNQQGRDYLLPGLKKTVRGPNVPAALGVVGGMSFLGNALEAKDRNKYDEWKRLMGLSDSMGPVVPGSRGDYTMNEGYFRPDQYTPVQFGAIPYAQYGGHFDTPMELSPIGQTQELLQSLSLSAAASAKANVNREKPDPAPPPNMKVEPNKTARKAYEYYVKEKSLDPHIAAGIVGNLYQESALKPNAIEKENTGNGRGIAQWDVRDRWKGLVNWAEKNNRDPYGLYTQLDYILEEPGESAKALKAMAKANTPEEAAYIFGKTYERPLDKKDVPHTENPARWDVRGGIARRLYDEFQEDGNFQTGGETGAGNLARYQQGGVVDHFKKQMLEKEGKYLITDKATNRTYYGYPGPNGKLIENSFEVLTGKTRDKNYLSPYSLAELDSMSEEKRDKAKVTPVGYFPLEYNPSIYGNPGLNIVGTSTAFHQTYDPQVRDKYYNNNNPADNYASYGCINCHKNDLNTMLKGFGDKDHVRVVDSRRSVDENNTLAQANNYLSHNPHATKLFFEQPGYRYVRRTWNPAEGIYEGDRFDYNPKTDTIIDKKDLGEVIVTARKPKTRGIIANVSRPTPEALTPLQQSLVTSNVPVNTGNVSIVDYLNERGIDSSKENRMQLAHSLGMNDYSYTAADNINLLRALERMQQEGSRTLPEDVAQQFSAGGDVDAGQGHNLRRTLAPVNREMANIEAERGETISGDFDQDGMNEHLLVGGQRHSSGGTPLMVPAGSFVFSDTKKMKIGGDFLQEFGKSATSKKKYTPAELAKQYNIDKYKAIILDPNSDKIDKDTAKLMIENEELKLSKLALLQEGMKGFPNGIPGIAMPLIQTALATTPMMNPNQAPDPNQAPPPPMETGEMRYGGLIKAAGGYSDPRPIDPYKGDKTAPRKDQRGTLGIGFNKFDASWLKDYGYGNSAQGLEDALLSVGYRGNLGDAKEVQKFLIQKNLEAGNSNLFSGLLKDYKITNQGLREGVYKDVGVKDDEELRKFLDQARTSDDPKMRSILEKVYADGLFGVRSGLMLQSLLPPKKTGPYGPPARFPSKDLDFTPLHPGEITFRPPQVKREEEEEQLPWTKTRHTPIHRWTQDDLNTGLALVNRFDLKKYGPTYVSPDVVIPRPTFFDPTRQLAANQEQAAAQNMMAAMYAGPQRQRGVGSNIQGQTASNAANIIGQVQNQNVGVANQFAGVTSDILNKKAMQDAIARKTYMDELAVANQQFDNSKMLANANVLTNLNSGITNAQETYWLNKMNEQYAIDPRSGRLSFTRGRPLSNTGNSSGAMNDAALYNYYYNQFKAANPGMSDADAKAFATMQIQDRLRSNNNNGDQAGGIGIANYMGVPVGRGRG